MFDLRIRYGIWKSKRAIAKCEEWLQRRETTKLHDEEAEAALSKLAVEMIVLVEGLRNRVAKMELYLEAKRHYREAMKIASGWDVEPMDLEDVITWLDEQEK